MFNEERSRSENLEEKTPEQITSNAISAIERNDVADSSEWVEKAKTFAKTSSFIAGLPIGTALYLTAKVLTAGFKFAKKSIEGKIGFNDGYEIGKQMLTFKKEKEKK